ncbi:DUF1654 domain-containing protein [Pseudomonas fulva]|nr:DUF1654 domain-containing protein [Pseudomonas fulva]MBF8780975.1 DUF1654 domain-containing protein [Pseudomonas fulva]
MAKQKKSAQQERQELTGVERLGLRISAMINHPIAQQQRWVTIHRLDSDGEREWEEVMGVLADTDGIDMTFNDDESVTLRWEASSEDDPQVEALDEFVTVEESSPF